MPINPSYKQAKAPRLTKPRGSFLGNKNQWTPPNPFDTTLFSNPSTAADGFLGGSQGMNPVKVSTPTWTSPNQKSPHNRPLFANLPGTAKNIMLSTGTVAPVSANTGGGQEILFNDAGKPLSGTGFLSTRPDLAWDVAGNRYKLDTSTGQYIRDKTDAFKPNNNVNVLGSSYQPYDSLVGMRLDANPRQLEFKTAMQIFAGLSNEQVISNMSQMGYEYVKGQRGGTFVLGQGGNGNGGYVDGASLAKGETVKTDWGTITGGTPTAEGVGQYAVAYKMKKGQDYNTVVKQDAAGNWVRYSIPVYQRKKYKGARPAATQTQETQTAQPTNEMVGSQLVNLRVNYG